MKKSIRYLLLSLLFALLLAAPAVAAQKNVKAKDIKPLKFNYLNGTVKVRFANRTKEKVTIDEWAGCWTSGQSGCDAALHLVNKKGKQLLSYSIKKGKTKTIYFKQPPEMLGEPETSDKIIFNFKTGNRKKSCVITFYEDVNSDGDEITKTKVKIRSGYKRIPYELFLPEPEEELEEEPYATYAAYVKVKPGMTYQQVAQIFGFHGTQGSNINGYITYNWDGPGYSYAYIVFYGGRVVSTLQYGLA